MSWFSLRSRHRDQLVGAALACGAILVATALAASGAFAQTSDHLRCRRVAGARIERSDVDVKTRLGIDAGCKVRRVLELCEPAYDEAVITAASAPPSPEPWIERLCYRLKCPRRLMGDVQILDGTTVRKVGVKTPSLICTPLTTP
jgi:hypothetical protein